MSESVLLDSEVVDFVLRACGANTIRQVQLIQNLWGGQGQLLRLHTDSPDTAQSVLKKIKPSRHSHHPRGWNTTASFARKLRSYEVESYWYQHYADQCNECCPVARLIGTRQLPGQQLILLEDLSIAYPQRCQSPDMATLGVCLDWLAAFHARFLQMPAAGLWIEGCYWHLETRLDEFEAMHDGPIKQSAHALDERLRHCEFRTLVHGDAKPANFCFSHDLAQTVAVDFQYVGGGCGIKDVVYLIGSCVGQALCESLEEQLLNRYFGTLKSRLSERDSSIPIAAVEAEWRSLYAIAWTDFYRFLLGWMPEHHKINDYTKALATRALAQL